MAESDEEVDVEDISDGEQISNLRDLAEEDQKDNWYDKDISNQNFLHSSSSPFSSDYCDPHSWLLDTNTVWSLDPCTDDKSRATIEKMILEEQMYAYRSVSTKLQKPTTETDKRKQSPTGRLPNTNAKKSIPKPGKEPSITHRKPWTVEEQELFKQGLGLYGRSWTKIANIIDTRTALQVKNYAKQYFKQKNKNLVKTEIHETQRIQEQCDETFVLANVEEIVNDNNLSEDEKTEQCREVSLGAKEKPECESDEDVEVDIDGSDSEEVNNILIPGQTTSCPEAVYSALVQAAATEENPKDPIIETSNFTSSEVNNAAVMSEDMLPCLLQPQSSSSAVLDNSLPINEVEVETNPSLCSISTETASPEECKSGEETNGDMNDTDRLSVFNSGQDNLKHDCGDSFSPQLLYECNSHESMINIADDINSSQLPNASHTVDTSRNTMLHKCHAAPIAKTVENHVNADNFHFDSNDFDSQCANNSSLEKNWAPVTCGEVTCSELIQPSDREQPGENTDNSSALYNQVVIDRNIIQEVEKEHNAEFFMGRALKTPERYMKIRNYILDMWEKTKPNYLFKTAARGGLRNCGDVNSIGRVHAFLEDIGAINEGCLDRPVPRVRQQGEVVDAKENVHMESWVNSLRPRKKRPRNKDGEWVDFSTPEGMTIQHLSPDEQPSSEAALNDKGSPTPPRKRPSRNKSSYDPFLLVPYRKFLSASAVPFDVLIQSETLVVMDTHAHMSTTEVIGLLGGNYLHESRILKVSKAIPCRSLSTGLQCEMDPVSQTQASEELAHGGLAVVGWYHSHPTFAPIPSVRDIETQAKFQEWFGKGGAPFVGIIVSPYNYSNPSSQSQIRCLTVSNEWESAGQYRLPYQFDFEVYENEADEDDTVEQVRSIADDYRTYPFRVQLNRRYGSSSDFDLLDKLLDSLRARVTSNCDGKREVFLARIKNTISENIKPRLPFQQSE